MTKLEANKGPFQRSKKILSVATIGAFVSLCGSFATSAEEGGSGHYVPGSMASFIDVTPPSEVFLMRFDALNYKGSVGLSRTIPIAGLTALSAKANSSALALTALWRPPVDLGKGWSYAMSASASVVKMNVKASIATGGGTVSRSSTTTGLGDLLVIPIMLNYTVNPDLTIDFRVAGYIPTGNYKAGRLANTGKNFWTLEPTVGLAYFGKQNGIEATLFAGVDFNTKNKATDYKSGTQVHLDGTLAQHFPFMGGLAGVGLNAYYYKQVQDDSGSGATLGGFRAKTIGLGPAVSYVTKIGANDLIAELKWLHETSTKNRLKGDTVFFKAVMTF